MRKALKENPKKSVGAIIVTIIVAIVTALFENGII